jgi:hypothetical protein
MTAEVAGLVAAGVGVGLGVALAARGADAVGEGAGDEVAGGAVQPARSTTRNTTTPRDLMPTWCTAR